MKRLRVLHVATGLGPGGVGKMLYQWFTRTDPTEIDIEMAVVRRGMFAEELNALGCNIMSIRPIRDIGPFRYMSQFVRLIRNGHYDVIHSHVGLASLFVFIPAIWYGVHVRVLHAHTNRFDIDSGNRIRQLLIRMLKTANTLLATDYISPTNEAADYFFGHKRRRVRERMEIVRNGINLDDFSFSPGRRVEVRGDRGVSEQTVFGCVGRLYQSKNQAFLLDVFRAVLANHMNCILWIVGEGPDSEYLRDRCIQLGIADFVHFIPPTPVVADLFQAMDVFVFPSKYEGLGIVVIEAQATGLPCVVSTSVPREVDVTGKVQFLSLDESPQAWANQAIESSKQQRILTTAQIRDAGYDISECTSSLNKIYRSAFSRRD